MPRPSTKPTHTPAPKRLRLKNLQASTTLPPGAHALVDDLVGTFIGSTRAEVLRYIVVSWVTSNAVTARAIISDRDHRRRK